MVISCSGWSQQLFWNQGEVYVMDSALVWVDGNFENTTPDAILQNEGEIYTRNGYQNGDFVLSDSAAVSGNGTYLLEGDWINSARFTSDQSRVFLEGDNEFISGDSVTTFYDLELRGTGVKTQLIDAFTAHELEINDRELAIDSFRMTVTNPVVASVLNDRTFLAEGFASTLNGGRLVRYMNDDSTYIFPMGSSSGTNRYRQLNIRPSIAGTDVFEVGFSNYDATLDAFPVANHDSIVCRVNDLYYHQIERPVGSSPVQLRMFYEAADGYFDQVAHWEDVGTNVWDTIGNDFQGFPDYRTIAVNDLTNFSPEPFALAILTPAAPSIIGDTIVCEPEILWAYEADPSNTGATYVWNIPNDAAIVSGTGTGVIDVDWMTSSGGMISVYEVDTNGCQSFTGMINVSLFPGLSANFDTTANPLYGVFEFGNYSSGADSYYWDFGDGNWSVDEHPTHQFEEPGLYEVILTAENGFGCTSMDTLLLEVIEGIDVPNVFTPNGDGKNDTFYANSIGITDKSVSIFNRWGKEIYTSTKLDFAWDGTNIWTGLPSSEGTYFYVIKAKSVTRDYEFNGHVMLER